MTRRALALLVIGVPVCFIAYWIFQLLLAGAYAWHFMKAKFV
jgi:hypothetical protein